MLKDTKLPYFSMTILEMLSRKTFWAALATIVSTTTAAYSHQMAWSMALPIIFLAIGQICQRDATSSAVTNITSTPVVLPQNPEK